MSKMDGLLGQVKQQSRYPGDPLGQAFAAGVASSDFVPGCCVANLWKPFNVLTCSAKV